MVGKACGAIVSATHRREREAHKQQRRKRARRKQRIDDKRKQRSDRLNYRLIERRSDGAK